MNLALCLSNCTIEPALAVSNFHSINRACYYILETQQIDKSNQNCLFSQTLLSFRLDQNSDEVQINSKQSM